MSGEIPDVWQPYSGITISEEAKFLTVLLRAANSLYFRGGKMIVTCT